MFRFTIRELVLLTVIVALAVGSWLDRSQLVQQVTQAELQAADTLRIATSFQNVLDVLAPDWRERLGFATDGQAAAPKLPATPNRP